MICTRLRLLADKAMHLHLLCVCYPGQAFRLALPAAKWGKEGEKGMAAGAALVVPWAVNTPLSPHPRLTPASPRQYAEVTAVCFMIALFYSPDWAFFLPLQS